MTDAPRHMLRISTLDEAALQALLARAVAVAGALEAGAAIAPALQGQTVANLFFEPSTRTRASFELAARKLGADVLNLDFERSSAAKGESLADTVRTLQAMGPRVFVIRHPEDTGIERLVAELEGLPLAVVSAGEGRAHHPTQGLLDAVTVQRHFGRCDGIRIAIVGDIAHSRVARSATAVFRRLGAEVRIAGPAALMPPAGELPGAARCDGFAEALAGAQVVMMLRVQRERIADAAPDPATYAAEWGLTAARLALAADDAVVMHPGPFNRGVEIESAVADGPRSLILKQVAHGVAARIAALEWAARAAPA